MAGEPAVLSQEWRILEPILGRLRPEERLVALREIASRLQEEEDLVTAKWLLNLTADGSDSIIDASVQQFLLRLRASGSVSAVADLCRSSENARSWQTTWTVSELTRLLPHLSQDAELEDFRSEALSHLRFLLQLGESSSNNPISWLDEPLRKVLFSCLSNEDIAISRATRNIYSAWLRSAHLRESASIPAESNHGSHLYALLWRQASQLAAEAHSSSHRSTGFWLWLQLLGLPTTIDHIRRPLSEEMYWKVIQQALADGDTELKRTAIAVLRNSLAVIHAHHVRIQSRYVQTDKNMGQVLNDFDKFATVYETIALSRYLGQVREAMPALEKLAGKTSTLHPSWLHTVLLQAFSGHMPDSVRNLLGYWVMSYQINAASYPQGFDEILEVSILPWAMQGKLFMSTLQKSRQCIRCAHGEKLSQFITDLVSTGPSESSALDEISYTSTIIRFLKNTAHRTSVYGIVYVVRGIFQAIQNGSSLSLSHAEAVSLAELCYIAGFSEPTRDCMSIMCLNILKVHVSSTRGREQPENGQSALDTRLAMLDQKVKTLRDPPEQRKKRTFTSLEQVRNLLNQKAPHRNCLKGPSFEKMCHGVTDLMQNPSSDEADETLIAEILAAIWEELERQDYPKNALMALPALWLSPLCLRLIRDGSEPIHDQVSSFLDTYLQMSQSRIHVWSSLAIAFRSAVLHDPWVLEPEVVKFVLTNAMRMPTPRPEVQLDAAVSYMMTKIDQCFVHLAYEHYYGDAPEVGYAAYFGLVNRLAHANSQPSLDILNDIRQRWTERTVSNSITSRWKTVEQLQVMMLLAPAMRCGMGDPVAQAVVDTRVLADFVHMLKAESLPQYRWMLECVISRWVADGHPSLMDTLFQHLSSNDHHGNPKFVASMVKVTVNIICSKHGTENIVQRFLERVVALCSSSKIVVRHEAQSCFLKLWAHAQDQSWSSVTQNPALIGLNDYIESLDKSQHMAERLNGALDLDADMCLATVLGGKYLALEPRASPKVALRDFQRLQHLDDKSSMLHGDFMPALKMGQWRVDDSQDDTVEAELTGEEDTTQAFEQVALQTKGTSYLSGSVDDFKSARQRSGLMVVASLVGDPHNIGGISRVTEIFGAAALYISSLNVLTNKMFESVAVSSHKHMDVKPLKVDDMIAFLAKQRLEGYSIVGIEQTDRSALLGAESTRLPKKTILVLGAEKEGMPAAVLAECDILVEIPQRGYTRSMNVQTAAGCVLYEYCRQHR